MNINLFSVPKLSSGRFSQMRRPNIFTPFFESIYDRDISPIELPLNTGEQLLAPPIDIDETDSEYIVTADLPGVKKEDISIECSGNQLTISAERKAENMERRPDFQERFYGTYQRSFTMPADVNADNIEASYDAGVLTVCVPKIERAAAKRITIT